MQVYAVDSSVAAFAEELASRYGWTLSFRQPESGLHLVVTPDDLPKVQLAQGGVKGRVWVDFASASASHRRTQGKAELIARAVDIRHHKHVIDATAGLGRDAFVLAGLGAQVDLYERHPVALALLENGLARAAQSSAADVCARMKLFSGSLEASSGHVAPVVYLDPMYPPRTKSAAVKKEMAFFHAAIGEASLQDETALLHTARLCARARVVVKRPRLGDTLAGAAPDFAYTGKSTRFDCYRPL